ncbi:uncharacterized protein V1510DRAFT_363316 [Dipodascopsis tothii]|uniref:uncharacterized protein n=1 Tax=Dipodascopsis tothii TaxID=44089 RepID=UPI0034CE7347
MSSYRRADSGSLRKKESRYQSSNKSGSYHKHHRRQRHQINSATASTSLRYEQCRENDVPGSLVARKCSSQRDIEKKQADLSSNDENVHLKGDIDGEDAPKPCLLPTVSDPFSFLTILSECLRLPLETVCLAMRYIHLFHKYNIESQNDKTLAQNIFSMDSRDLVLTSLSLATKTTESPRRFRELLVPAYHILHSRERKPRLTFPSHTYDSLRAGLVSCELILLRILNFDTRLPLALYAIPSIVSNGVTDAIFGVEELMYHVHGFDRDDDNIDNITEHSLGTMTRQAKYYLGSRDRQRRRDYAREYGICGVEETTVGRISSDLVLQCYKNYELSVLFEARELAVACVYSAAVMLNYTITEEFPSWVEQASTGTSVERVHGRIVI